MMMHTCVMMTNGLGAPRTADVGGELFGPRQALILAYATTMLPLLAVLPLLLL